MVQRVCGTGIEVLMQAADFIAHKDIELALCVGAESMSRNPVASYTMRGFRMGAVDFKDFLWEALLDPAANVSMGDTAENLARQYQITRPQVDAFAAQSFERALAAQRAGFFTGEITPVRNERFERQGYQPRELNLRGTKELATDTHVRPSPLEALAGIRPAFGGVQTGGNSSAIVDGAAAALVASSDYARKRGKPALARIVAGATVGVPPEVMGIGPVPAIKAVLARAGLTLADIDRFEINEAFGAQVMACARELGIDEAKLNVNGGAIAIGHPLGATGVRLAITLARELGRARLRYGIASACIGGGQGIALLIENPDATPARKNRTMEIKVHAAVVTGGASGLGAATAEELARAGAKVACLDVNLDGARAVAERIGGCAVRCDVTDGEQAAAALAQARDQHGAARILINCAGVGPAKRIVGRDGPMPLADFERVIAINLIGTFNMMRLAAADMQNLSPLADEERGVIISAASVAAFEGQIGQAAYSASKGGVAALTMPAAREFAQFGIRVNAIAPGIFHTPMLMALPEEAKKSLAAAVPFPKLLGRPDQFASLARHIIENTYINGEVIRLDGALRMAPR
jgi:acetyl-CoA C-acetyltransferase